MSVLFTEGGKGGHKFTNTLTLASSYSLLKIKKISPHTHKHTCVSPYSQCRAALVAPSLSSLNVVFQCPHTHALSTLYVPDLIHDCTRSQGERKREGWHCGRVPSVNSKGGGEKKKKKTEEGEEVGEGGARGEGNRQIPAGGKARWGEGVNEWGWWWWERRTLLSSRFLPSLCPSALRHHPLPIFLCSFIPPPVSATAGIIPTFIITLSPQHVSLPHCPSVPFSYSPRDKHGLN